MDDQPSFPHLDGPKPDAPSRPSRRQNAAVAGLIALTILAVVLMLAIIGYRWMIVTEPTTGIVVQGTAEHAGTEIEVTDGARTYRVVLDKTNDYLTPVMLTPGDYTLTASQPGKKILKQRFTVSAYRGLRFDLPTFLPISATGPSQNPPTVRQGI